MPVATHLAAWTEWFTEHRFLGNAAWQWLALLGVLLGGFLVGKVASFILERQGRRLKDRLPVLAMLLQCLQRPVGLLVLSGEL